MLPRGRNTFRHPAASSRSLGPLLAVLAVLCALVEPLIPASRATPGQRPPYPHGAFEEDCSMCHSPDSWSPAVIGDRFDHARRGFKLEGAHSTGLCRSCHISLEFDQVDSTCVSCHADVHNGELGPDCASCHSTSDFIDRASDVRSHYLTRFPLTGAHVTLSCNQCHPAQPQGGLRFVNTPMDCESCHMSDFISVKSPDHVALNFDRDCSLCHASTSFDHARFDHQATDFPLIGAHQNIDCSGCHTAGQFSGTPAQCFSCHQQDFQAAVDPDHVAAGFPTQCQECHSRQTWQPAQFDHAATGFPLTGFHGGVACRDCHVGGAFSSTAADCSSCHLTDYQQAPNHLAGNFPQTCEDCHTVNSWSGATIAHDFFPLTQGHAGAACESCHTTGVFQTIPSECSSCHDSDYQQAPGHVASGFSLNCEQCHNRASWVDADFDHGFFSLTGGHNGLSCVACHTSGTFGTIPSDCFSCHQSDYQTAPDHQALALVDCQSCHNTTSWGNVDFVHSFPLNGPHGGRSCSDCHVSGSADSFSCLGSCHQHTSGRMADKHSEVNGYAYDFLACVSCHPNGRS